MVAVGTAVEFVERTDPRHGAARVGMIRRGFFEATIDVSPAASEHDPRTRSCAGLVGAECIGDDYASILAGERTESGSALVIANSMDHHAWCRKCPHLPRLRCVSFES